MRKMLNEENVTVTVNIYVIVQFLSILAKTKHATNVLDFSKIVLFSLFSDIHNTFRQLA